MASRLTTAPGSPEAAEALTGFPVAGGVPFATRLAFSAGTVQRDVQRLQPRHGAASRSAQAAVAGESIWLGLEGLWFEEISQNWEC